MLQPDYRMAQKAVFQITPQSELPCSLLEMLQGSVYDFIRQEFGFDPDWSRFCGFSQLESMDQRTKLQTAIYEYQGENGAIHWALRLTTRDTHLRRRNWQVQVSVRVEAGCKATLSYVEMYHDHLAGSFAESKPPLVSIPSLFYSLLNNARLACKMGRSALPMDAIAVSAANVKEIAAMILDLERHIPVVMISCPDMLSPKEAARQLLANAVVCWLNDVRLFDELQMAVHREVQLDWDTVQVLMPLAVTEKKSFHPILTVSDITRFGHMQILSMLRQAYCVNLRSDERKRFMTVENIHQRRDRDNALALRASVVSQEEELKRLRAENERLKSDLDALQRKYDNETDEKLKEEISSLESMVNDVMSQNDSLKLGIQTITQQLYACMGKGFSSADTGEAFLDELQHAILVCFARLGGGR